MNKTFATALTLAFCLLGITIPTYSQNCNLTVDAGPDQVLCAPGDATINANASEIPLFINWSPTDGLSDPTSLNTTATVSTTTSYEVTVSSTSPVNLITNGDFSQGDVGFTSDYIYGTGGGVGLLSNEGQYAIADDAGDTHNHFDHCDDHTGGGEMMVVNGSGDPDNVWCQTVNISQNTAYFFSAWVTSVVTQNPADLQFSVNGNLLGTVFNAPSNTCSWNEFSTSWYSGPVTTIEICIANVNDDPAGNDFAIDDITLFEICESTDEITITVADLNANFSANNDYCQDEAAFSPDLFLGNDATPDGEWTLDGTAFTTFDPASISAGMHTLMYTVVEGNCEVSSQQQINITAATSAGNPLSEPSLCEGESTLFTLADLLEGEDMGGEWEETSTNPSSPGAFNDISGTFDTDGQLPGTYTFRYTTIGNFPCPDDESVINIIINAAPIADAGEELSLGCGINEVSIGGSATSTDGNYSYQWTSLGGSPVVDPNMPFTEVEKADTYILTVTDLDSGCTATDEVTITANVNTVEAFGFATPLSCFGENDGTITVDSVAGGTAPYSYALDDGVFTSTPSFSNLAAGNYLITVRDANGCEVTEEFIIPQAQELSVQLISNANTDPPLILLGDSLNIELLVNKPIEEIVSINWSENVENCDNCTSFNVSPSFNSSYTVEVEDIGGCTATASINVSVNRDLRIFVPNAFSPNDDGINDLFMIYSGNQINLVKSFQVMNRWGDLIFTANDFQPEDPENAWDGSFNGKMLNPGVYIYLAEVELADGEVVVISGDVTLLY